MRKMQLLSTVAAAILLSFSVASAQSDKGESHKPPQHNKQMNPSASQNQNLNDNERSKRHSAGAENRGASQQKQNAKSAGEPKSSTTGQASENQLNGPKAHSGQPGEKGHASNSKSNEQQKAGTKKHGTSSHAKRNESNHQNAGVSKSSTTGQSPRNESESHNNASNRSSTSDQGNRNQSQTQNNASNKNQSEGQNSARTKSSTTGPATQNESKGHSAGTSNPKTTGAASSNSQSQQANGPARAQGVNLTTQQQTKIRQTVFAKSNVPRVDHVDFSVSVGADVPSHVHLVTVPDTLVEIYPKWRGDDYFVARDEIIIVDHSRKIVAVIPNGGHRAAAGSSTTVVNLSSDEIRQVQLVLIHKGFLNGDADGDFGPKTRHALIEFQQRQGIQATGKIDRRTVSSLGLSSKIQVGGATGKSGTGNTSSTVGQASHQPKASQQNEPSNKQAKHPSNKQANQPSDRRNSPTKRSTTGQGNSMRPSDNAAQPHANKRMQPGKEQSSHRSVPSTTGQGSGQPSAEKSDHNRRRNDSKDQNQ